MRLVTRGDLDGLACATIITSNEDVDEVLLIHPQDITDHRVEICDTDILANLPYHPSCAKWFDHHLQTDNNHRPPEHFEGAYQQAPSAAGLVYDYYGGVNRMPELAELVRQTDRLDSALLTREDITNPSEYILLGYSVDSRSGHGEFESYFELLLDLLKTASIEEILGHPTVKERCERMRADDSTFRDVLKANSRVDGNVVVTDLRDVERVPTGNRFLIYALYPQVNVSVRVHWGPAREFAVVAVGHSILQRTCKTKVGELMSRYGGGGHAGAGTTPLVPERADADLAEIIEELKRNG